MVDVVLLFGRVLLLALLYLFLWAAVRTGMGLVRSGSAGEGDRALAVVVISGPPELRGVKVPLDRQVRIGRSPDLELVIADDFVSTSHAQIVPAPGGPVLEDLASTNGTLVNGSRVRGPVRLATGDLIEIGTVKLKVARL